MLDIGELTKSHGNLEDFGACQKALRLFDRVAEDFNYWLNDFSCSRLAFQSLAGADSACANMEEGFGRESRKQFRHYLIIARGPARETSGRYKWLQYWIPTEIVHQQVALADETGSILTSKMKTLTQQVNPLITSHTPLATNH